MIKDTLKLWGRLRIYRNNGSKQTLIFDEQNTIVNAGKLLVLDSINGDSTASLSRIAIGNGNVPNISPLVTDTTIANEIDTSVFSSTTKDTVNRIIEYRVSFASSDITPGSIDPEEINEAAIFFDDGTMLSRKTFNARNFLIADSISLTFAWSVGVA